MAQYRTLKMDFWSDPFIEDLPYKGKYVYLYLITSSHTNNLGILDISRRKISYETGMPPEEVEAQIEYLRSKGKLFVDGTSILLVNFIKNQTSNSPNMKTHLSTLFPSVESAVFRAALLEKYPFLGWKGVDDDSKTIEGVSIPIQGVSIPVEGDGIPLRVNELELVFESESESESECETEKEKDSPLTPPSGGERTGKISETVPEKSGRSKSSSNSRSQSPEFVRFWEAYPRKVAKDAAWQIWRRLLRGNFGPPPRSPDDLVAAAVKYADECRAACREQDKILHARTFLGPQRRWTDYVRAPDSDRSDVGGEPCGNGREQLPEGGEVVDYRERIRLAQLREGRR